MTSRAPLKRGTKPHKRVRFGPDPIPIADKPRKRRREEISPALDTKTSKKIAPDRLKVPPSYASRLFTNTVGAAISTAIGSHRLSDIHENSPLHQQGIEPFNPETDWFKTMHTHVSCKATPAHIIGVKEDETIRWCEGIETLDQVLLKGEVQILFHPDTETEPVCEVCWPASGNSQTNVRMPGSWPSEEKEETAHTHLYSIAYMGCRLYKEAKGDLNYQGHSIRLVKGNEGKGGTGMYCRCGDKPLEEISGEKMPIYESKIIMPHFAGCPACEGKDILPFVKAMT
ncbi:hypothetical protein ABW19_dt0205084 [Dactylella cylindrospora]|nr:hypothetical protein ABW19_dt0205084 [Dactylella cylindrospora]